ncbi:FAD-dependent oxidoreductase [Streptomyces alkaliterrae]|uniref:FAD-dependent oxidoreductase n=1 Tax=Streptomyces alkaliterrae TaxID=2213162 RepID=A0A5P0YRP0_9ACTN|nr:FAD-dependent oxidoreductase [Streptomyces alkaliterrae]MBB1261092.1 FAD-dependent oxidoreductase [Streptomyces alkaliterrae]MQS02994.1 flavoprotein oxidoreductase [Streptomyces alkaliterrae]
MPPTERLVIVGGDAAGMSAAAQARRLRGPDELEIVAFERGAHTSYSACGIPYWVSDTVSGPDALVARSPAEHRARGVDVRTRTEVVELDLPGRRVRTRAAGERDGSGGGEARESWTSYDRLVLATGARPIRPDLPGADAPGVHCVQTLGDGEALLRTLAEVERRPEPRHAVVVGAGYIGVEMAEALALRGYRVTVLDKADQPMTTLDPDMGELVRDAMAGMGINTVTGAGMTGVETGEDGLPRAVLTEDDRHPADVVVLGLGVRPETTLAAAAGLPLGASGGLLTDLGMRVRGRTDVWAGGDCVEVLNLVSGQPGHVPLGTHANKHGQVIGTNAAGGYATFPGVVGTAVSRVCDLEIARTGLLEAQAREAGLRFVTTSVTATSRSGYFPGARPMTVKMLAERRTGRLLGVQIVGREGAAKRVDVAAVALTAKLTVEQMTSLDLGYAPPFSPVWDPVLAAARKAAAAVREAGPD